MQTHNKGYFRGLSIGIQKEYNNLSYCIVFLDWQPKKYLILYTRNHVDSISSQKHTVDLRVTIKLSLEGESRKKCKNMED